MRFKKLMRYLKKWQGAGLISEEQVQKITEDIKIESHRQFLKLIRALFILGAFWIVVGIIATLRLINIKILLAIGSFLYKLVTPVIILSKVISPEHYRELLAGILCLLAWGLFHWLGIKLRKKSDRQTTELGFLQVKELRLGTTSFTIGYILASIGWQLFNYIIYSADYSSSMGKEALFPFFSFLGMIFFATIAYLMQDQIALLFGIGFLAHTVGLFSAYFFACYTIGVKMPVISFVVGILLVFIGLWHLERAREEEENFQFLFGRTYEWVGLLFVFLSLWIMSIWGGTFKEGEWLEPSAVELWVTNILFISATLIALFLGAVGEDRLFFNFGLTFFIIESYALFFSHVWATTGTAFGSLLLGAMLVGTGYALRYLWLKGYILKREKALVE